VFLIVSWSKPEPYKRHITISVQGPACDLLVPVGIDIVDLPALRPDRPTTYKMASMYHTCVAPPRMNDDDIVTQGSDTEEGTNDGVGPPPYHAGTDIKHGICCYICTSYKTTTWFKMMEHVRRMHGVAHKKLKGTYFYTMARSDANHQYRKDKKRSPRTKIGKSRRVTPDHTDNQETDETDEKDETCHADAAPEAIAMVWVATPVNPHVTLIYTFLCQLLGKCVTLGSNVAYLFKQLSIICR